MPGNPEDFLNRRIDRNRRNAESRVPPKVAPEKESLLSQEMLNTVAILASRKEENAVDMHLAYFDNIGLRSEHINYAWKRQQAEPKDKVSAEKKLIADAFEYIISCLINKGNLFGEDTQAKLASPYDDRHNAIDLYIENPSEKVGERGTLGLAIDLTYGAHGAEIGEKFSKLKRRSLDTGELSQLQYYLPTDIDPKKAAEVNKSYRKAILLPSVIVGVSGKWATSEIMKFGTDENVHGGHPALGFTLLRQIELQLNAFREYSIYMARVYTREKKHEMAKQCTAASDVYDDAYQKYKDLLDRKIERLGATGKRGREKIDADMEQDELSKQIVAQVNGLLKQTK